MIVVLSLLAAVAPVQKSVAVGPDYTLAVPDGFLVVADAEVDGKREGSVDDVVLATSDKPAQTIAVQRAFAIPRGEVTVTCASLDDAYTLKGAKPANTYVDPYDGLGEGGCKVSFEYANRYDVIAAANRGGLAYVVHVATPDRRRTEDLVAAVVASLNIAPPTTVEFHGAAIPVPAEWTLRPRIAGQKVADDVQLMTRRPHLDGVLQNTRIVVRTAKASLPITSESCASFASKTAKSAKARLDRPKLVDQPRKRTCYARMYDQEAGDFEHHQWTFAYDKDALQIACVHRPDDEDAKAACDTVRASFSGAPAPAPAPSVAEPVSPK